MAFDRETRVDTAMRPLTREEIDRRIQGVIEQVAAIGPEEGEEALKAAETMRPRWISAAELVRRLRPFIVYN